ncbi:unnamed protein product, partial [Timema podura]|nr:unnamed protein product [Timema podura]
PQHAEKALRTVEKGERREGLVREASVQSDVTSHTDSHCSSMESYLESRRANPEEVLLGLGFGGPRRNVDSDVSRIPQRFLNPSKVKGVAIDDFLRHQQDLAETFESGFSGYRGLIGDTLCVPVPVRSQVCRTKEFHPVLVKPCPLCLARVDMPLRKEALL